MFCDLGISSILLLLPLGLLPPLMFYFSQLQFHCFFWPRGKIVTFLLYCHLSLMGSSPGQVLSTRKSGGLRLLACRAWVKNIPSDDQSSWWRSKDSGESHHSSMGMPLNSSPHQDLPHDSVEVVSQGRWISPVSTPAPLHPHTQESLKPGRVIVTVSMFLKVCCENSWPRSIWGSTFLVYLPGL